MWIVTREHQKDGKTYVDFESNESSFFEAWERGKQFSEDYEAVEGDTIMIKSPDGNKTCIALYENKIWRAF